MTHDARLTTHDLSIHWFRRDLRLQDNAALYHALKSGFPVLPIFIFDTNILNELKDKDSVLTTDNRVAFIHQEITRLKNELQALGSDLLVFYGKPIDVWKEIIQQYAIRKVFTNHDYEPYATERDAQLNSWLQEQQIEFLTYKDQVIFEKDEVTKDDGKPYTVYTPYSKKWKLKLNDFYLKSYPTEKYTANFFKIKNCTPCISLHEMGFSMDAIDFPVRTVNDSIMQQYAETRDIPSIRGTSRISVHLRFGTVSIRELARQSIAAKGEKYLNELIWRDFYMMILHHFPKVVTQSFNEKYDKIKWRNNEVEYKAWCDGKTGYPIVDAGMRELNATGFMHNRVRMIVASFLTKHLLIDWRLGEAYFAKKLLDYDLSANNGGWQWAAGTGVDAAPYFRVFNPRLQTEKFDKELKYIRTWIPELDSFEYPKPIVEHAFARDRCLAAYKEALS
ncbi:MAG TPA: deoxyribodipyrimidine photo-lyase [Chitinophagales bacterium]|nr:deoxyribodipyrimidine photo-lyase [Chitinophagales bacterium]